MIGTVLAVCLNTTHVFSKTRQDSIRLLVGLGVAGDAHMGATVKHRSRVAKDASQPNLRQVHWIHAELPDRLNTAGFDVAAGDLGENITTRGIELLSLPRGARLYIGGEAEIALTGLRNPCRQLDAFQSGLTAAVLDRDAHGNLIRKAGVMGIVLSGGNVRPGDKITVALPPEPHVALEPV